jgi:hypothetical protein
MKYGVKVGNVSGSIIFRGSFASVVESAEVSG